MKIMLVAWLLVGVVQPHVIPHATPRPACAVAVSRALLLASELKVQTYQPTATATMTLEKRLGQLRALSQSNGHAMPTADNSEMSLVRWAARQRALQRKGLLPTDLVEELEACGFVFDVLEHAWETRYEELERFFAAHGTVPSPQARGRLEGGSPANAHSIAKARYAPTDERRCSSLPSSSTRKSHAGSGGSQSMRRLSRRVDGYRKPSRHGLAANVRRVCRDG